MCTNNIPIEPNKTRSLYYHLCIVSNGRLSELDLIGHLFTLPGDPPPDFRMYEAMNYDDYNQIPLAMFNITWDNFILFQHPQFALYQRELHQEELTDFHRSLQYMTLYHLWGHFMRGILFLAIETPRIQNHIGMMKINISF